MAIYRFVVRFNTQNDPRSRGLLLDAHALGFMQIQRIECLDLYFIKGQLQNKEVQQLALKLLSDPVTQIAEWDVFSTNSLKLKPDAIMIEVALRHGVTDTVADEIVRASHQLGMNGVQCASTGYRYLIYGANEEIAHQLAQRLLANMVIHRWTMGEVKPSFPVAVASSGKVKKIRLCQLSDQELLEVSKKHLAALDLAEMQVIQNYCERESRDLTDIEFETIAQTWSEHCVHKTFKGKITIDSGTGKITVVDSIFKTYIRSVTEKINAPWVLSSFVDNAGIIDLDGENEISFKVETHNHPSAIEPFGGANTGVGGVIRDVLGVSHKPIANTDILCFGMQDASFDELPIGVLHPRRIMSGVVAGVQDYGNKMGIPTINGAIVFDPGYAANPLVYCGTIGISPKGMHMCAPKEGDRVIVIGGGTGRDGLRGATFSSMTMDAQTGEVSGSSVQIGNPIIEKGLVDVIIPARNLHLYHAITDCGAGGLSSAVGEMSSKIGAEVDLTKVKLKYPGLAPWEIWLSEAQERMVLAVPPVNLDQLQELCNTFNIEMTDIGEFTSSGRLVVRFGIKVVLDLSNKFLHESIPQRQLKAIISSPEIINHFKSNHPSAQSVTIKSASDNSTDILLKLLSHPNIASKSSVIRIYDHEVQGGTVVKPLTGVQNDGPSDACVLKPMGAKGRAGIAIGNGINPEYGKRDAYRMALSVVDEAVRNVVAVGVNPKRIAILDNFCWGDPLRQEILGSMVEAARGCHDAAMLLCTPLISGKDSLNNEYRGKDGRRHSIPPTLLISSVGVLTDVTNAITMDLKEVGNMVYMIGEFLPTFGGSHYGLICDPQIAVSEPVPSLGVVTPKIYQALNRAILEKLVCACHDLSEGGLAVAVAEMCIGGRLGLTIELSAKDTIRALFGETNGCLLVEVNPRFAATFENLFAGLPIERIGRVREIRSFTMKVNNNMQFTIPVDTLVSAWNTPL